MFYLKYKYAPGKAMIQLKHAQKLEGGRFMRGVYTGEVNGRGKVIVCFLFV